MSTSAFDRFREGLERGVTSRQDLASLDLVALRELDDLKREQARQLLAPHLDAGDPRVVDALAELDRPAAWALLDRSAVLRQLVQLAFRGDSEAVPDSEALDQLQDGERDWAVDLLLGRLEADDPRVLPALNHLGGERVRLALADFHAGRRIR